MLNNRSEHVQYKTTFYFIILNLGSLENMPLLPTIFKNPNIWIRYTNNSLKFPGEIKTSGGKTTILFHF